MVAMERWILSALLWLELDTDHWKLLQSLPRLPLEAVPSSNRELHIPTLTGRFATTVGVNGW